MNKPALRVVDSGEIPADAPTYGALVARVNELEDLLAASESDRRKWALKFRELERDKEAEARDDELWAEAEAVFGYWRLKCRHPKSQFTVDRFEAVRPYLKKYGAELCRRAIDGAAFDPYTVTRRNGSAKRFDGWDLIHRDADKWEDFANRAPRGDK